MVTEVMGLVTEAMRKRLDLLDLHEVLAVAHADGLVVDELAVAGDGDGSGGDGELLAEGCGDAAHLAALLAVGTPVLRLREGFEGGDVGWWLLRRDGEKVFEDESGGVRERSGIGAGCSFRNGREELRLENENFILSREER